MDLCRELLELILNLPVKEVRLAQGQKAVDLTYDGRGVRFDVYVEDADNTVFDIEMQVDVEKQLPKRFRYYQGMIDLNILSSGERYSKLRKTFIIFICLKDPIGAGYPVYHFRTLCAENPEIVLKDEAEKIIVNADGDRSLVTPRMAAFPDYIKGKKPEDEFVERLDSAVEKTKAHNEWRLDYMSLMEKLRDEREEGRAEGRAEGRSEGRHEAELSFIEKLRRAGMTPEQIRIIMSA